MNNRKRDFSKEEGETGRENDEKRVKKGNSLSPNHGSIRQPLRDVTNILPNEENGREGNTQKCNPSVLKSNEILNLSNIDLPSTSTDQVDCQIRGSLDDLPKDEKLANTQENKKETKEEEDSDLEEEAFGTQQARPVFLLLPAMEAENVRRDKLLEARHVIPVDFMEGQDVLREHHRRTLVDWLRDVSQHCQLTSEILALGVRIMDSFFSIRKNLAIFVFQLVGAVSLRLAAKIEGNDGFFGVDVVVNLCANTYTENMAQNMEKIIFLALKRHLFVTPFNFVRFFVRNAGGDLSLKLASYLCELSLMESTSHQFLPSLIAAAALYCARQILRREIPWDAHGFQSGYTVDQIAPCASLLHRLYEEHQNPQNDYPSMFVHYDTIDNYQVSSLPPFNF